MHDSVARETSNLKGSRIARDWSDSVGVNVISRRGPFLLAPAAWFLSYRSIVLYIVPSTRTWHTLLNTKVTCQRYRQPRIGRKQPELMIEEWTDVPIHLGSLTSFSNILHTPFGFRRFLTQSFWQESSNNSTS